MAPIRVLVVDDSVVIRRLVSEMLNSEPGIEVAATAPNGRIALAKLPQVKPDLVLLDVEMPELDGLSTLTALRAQAPKLPVLMFSQYTQRGAATTLEALSRGANDYVSKPDFQTPNAVEQVRAKLLEKIKGLTASMLARPSWQGLPPKAPVSELLVSRKVEAVVIGSSTGGPSALGTLLSALPESFSVPILVAQHMPPLFTRLLAERLHGECRLDVSEASNGEPIVPGRVYLCPGDYHLELKRGGCAVRCELTQGPPENSCRPSVDVLFRSAVAVYGAGVLGVVLTGMGRDGLKGGEMIRAEGGTLLAQDEATSVVWGMPGAVARAGLANRVLPLDRLASEMLMRVRQGRTPSTCGC